MNNLVYVILLLVVLLMLIASVRARILQLRGIDAYSRLPFIVGEAVESDKGVHMSFGGSAVRDSTTLSAFASAEVLYHLAERAALSDKPVLVTLSDPVTLALGQDTLRRAYKAREMIRKYNSDMVRWYPQGSRSLAFAAGAGAALVDQDASLNVLLGGFGPEMMLLAESAVRHNGMIFAQSDHVDGQAIAYVVSETPLIGEELYVGEAYLGQGRLAIGAVFAQDVVRYLIIIIIIGLAILSLAGTTF